MWSQAQKDAIDGLVPVMREQGYKYYLAYQQYTSNYNQDLPDVIVYFSKDEIFGTSLYRYTIPRNSLKYALRTGNGSSSVTSNRVTVDENQTTEVGLTIPSNVHCCTNATFMTAAVQPDLFVTEVMTYETLGGLFFMFTAFIFFYAFVHFFRR